VLAVAEGTAGRHPLYVIGHKNPDTDAVCAAIGFAALLRGQGRSEAVAARQGELRPETAYVLERFGVEVPVLVTDVRPTVADVMASPVASVPPAASLLEVGRLLRDRDVRVVAVTEKGRLLGVCGIADLAQAFIQLDDLTQVTLELPALLATLEGTLLVDAPGRPLGNRVMVGAMDVESMVRRLEPGVLLVIGDRPDAQRAAIEFGVGGLVVTGDQPVAAENVELARVRGVRIITVRHHTFTTLRLIQLSSPVRHVMQRDVATCHPDDLVEVAQEQLREGPRRSLMVVDDDGVVRGIVSRSTLLRPVNRQVALVDHNERGQAVTGIEEAEVVAVIDHHRVADFWTRHPPYMRLEPVGATSTIVAKLFDEARVEMTSSIAGVLLSAILADTLLFRGPTTTAEDRRVAARLAEVAGVDSAELGDAILSIASDVSRRPAGELIAADFKEFSVDACRFGIGTLETTSAAPVLGRRGEFLAAMAGLEGYDAVLFAVIDIVRERTTILCSRYAETVAEVLGGECADAHEVRIKGIMSRKKMIVPHLGALCRAIGRSG
jgi:manganese-dependent inorganic pyrophosphatase